MNVFQMALLRALNIQQQSGKHIYAGTVPPDAVAKRRAKDKAAKAARKVRRRNAK